MLLYADGKRGIMVEYNQNVPGFIVVMQQGCNNPRLLNSCDKARIRVVFTNSQISSVPFCTDIQVRNTLFGEHQSVIAISGDARERTRHQNVCKMFVLKNTHHWELNKIESIDILEYDDCHGGLQSYDYDLIKRLLPKTSDITKAFELNTRGFDEITLLTVTSPII